MGCVSNSPRVDGGGHFQRGCYSDRLMNNKSPSNIKLLIGTPMQFWYPVE